MKRWKIVVPAALIVLFVAWYVFRPVRPIVNRRVQEKLPAAETNSSNLQTLESGSFHSLLHPTQGTATVYRVGDGGRLLRFTNQHVERPGCSRLHGRRRRCERRRNCTARGLYRFGTDRGNVGDQKYALGSDVDLSKYRAVSVWCKRFSVNFGTAPLIPDHIISEKQLQRKS